MLYCRVDARLKLIDASEDSRRWMISSLAQLDTDEGEGAMVAQ